jgi:hypothetical protein
MDTDKQTGDADMDRYILVSITQPLLWCLGVILAVFVVVQVLVRRDAHGKSPELRLVISWVFLVAAVVMLVNCVIVFNVAVFSDTASYWPSVLLFLTALICTGISAMARYCA